MSPIKRDIVPLIQEQLDRGKSILLLGPRQVGKTTLARNIQTDVQISLIETDKRQYYERSPAALRLEITELAKSSNKPPLVFIDEIQLVPELMNEIQGLIDNKIAQFILSGSSARKLLHQNHVNLLPGRVIRFRMDPLTNKEISALPYSLEDRLYFGSLPAIVLEPTQNEREQVLTSYVDAYLEDEVRREALVRNVAQFGRFLELAASESGKIINLSKLSQDVGVAHTTIGAYYQILEDCLIAKRIEPFTQTSTRRRLVKSPRYLFFDLGVRRICAKESYPVSTTELGYLFEQWVGLELLKWLDYYPRPAKQIFFWRDNNGAEVDWVIKRDKTLIPIEVKWTDMPSSQDCKYLRVFMKEYGCAKGWVFCRSPMPMDLGGGITAIPWNRLWEWLLGEG